MEWKTAIPSNKLDGKSFMTGCVCVVGIHNGITIPASGRCGRMRIECGPNAPDRKLIRVRKYNSIYTWWCTNGAGMR